MQAPHRTRLRLALPLVLVAATGCPKDGVGPTVPVAVAAQVAQQQALQDEWREPPVLEGGTRITFGEVVLDAMAVQPPDGGSPGLVLLDAGVDGAEPHPWATIPSSFEGCASVSVELIEIEGLEQSGILMTQLLCDRPTMPAERLSSTALIRLDPGASQADVLWAGEGWSLNDRDLCLTYEVYSFRASKDLSRVEVLLDREVIATPTPGMATDCRAEPFGQESIEVIQLARPASSEDETRGDDEAETET